MTGTDHLRCVVERTTYLNSETGFAVLQCRAKGYPELVTVVGNMPEVHSGSVLSLEGAWKMDARYGRQFSVTKFEETLPATVYGIEKYLGSGLIKGIGPKFAHLIVNAFGKDTLEVIEQEPDKLLQVRGLGKLRVERIKKSWETQKEIKNIMLFLQSHDISTAHATRIYKKYEKDSLRVVKENPYRLADDIWGIGFKTADAIATKLGFGHDRYERLRAGLLYTLNQLSDEGHCFATANQLIKTGATLLEVYEDLLKPTLRRMIAEEDVIVEQEKRTGQGEELPIYLPAFYHGEIGVAKMLRGYRNPPRESSQAQREMIDRIEQEIGMEYDSVQRDAILAAINNDILILTGGPGTGKTTTTLGIISALAEAGKEVLLAAPTGRAAKRLSETTEMEAKTIHRLLEFNPQEGFQRNEDNPLEGDVLIVDECSMIDIMLMFHLLKAVPADMSLIFVGDVDQLPSVGAGNVLRDLIDSGVFPVIRLTRIFRQAQSSRIITNAHRINHGKYPDISNGKQADFFYIENKDPEQVAAEIVNLVAKRLPKTYRVSPWDIQVLTPMRRGVVGTANLNQLLQATLNPGAEGLKRGGSFYKERDKVMQIRNNYEKEVFNGDIGVIREIDFEAQELAIEFDGRLVKFDVTELDELVLAYASTIHKAQGSEYPIVVMPLLMTHYVMLQRNLIYTGITRAKKVFVLIGEKKALGYAVRNMTVSKRNTLLKQRLQGGQT